MSIFGDNIKTELTFESILQAKFSQAVRKAAALCWAQSANFNHEMFESMVKWQVCDELGSIALASMFHEKREKFLHQGEFKFHYIAKGDGRVRVWVYNTLVFRNKDYTKTSYDLNESILIKF